MLFPEQFIANVIKQNPLLTTIKEETDCSIFKSKVSYNTFFADKCPICGSKNTFYVINEEYYCHSCGKGGNVIGFIMKHKNLSFVDSVLYLAKNRKMILINPTEAKPKCLLSPKAASIMEINAIAAKYYFEQLRTPAGKQGMAYFNNREVPEAVKISFGLGYAGSFGDSLYKLLKSKGYSESAIMDSGLISKSTKPNVSNPFYDKFWDRVIFPIFNANGDVVAFGGRVLDDSKPKYLNSPETAAYTKGEHLFGYDKAQKSKLDYFICCEGYMDAMSLHQFGFNNAVASLGTALTKNQIKLLSTKKEVVLAYDSDAAGINATKRAILLCNEANVPVRVLQMSGAKDPDEFLKKYGASAFEKLIKNAEESRHFLIRNSKTEDGKIDFDTAIEYLL